MGVNTNSARLFSAAVKKVAKEIRSDYETEARRLALLIFSRVVLRSPVDDGLLRNNWNISLNHPTDDVSTTEDSTGGQATVRALASLRLYKIGDGIWLTNNLPYAPVWEYGTFVPPNPGPSSDPRTGRFGVVLVSGGFSLQAPKGMLGVTVEEVIGGIL